MVLNRDAVKKENLNFATTENPSAKRKAFGCTSVAFGQVMYALREYPGFRDLRYTNGEKS